MKYEWNRFYKKGFCLLVVIVWRGRVAFQLKEIQSKQAEDKAALIYDELLQYNQATDSLLVELNTIGENDFKTKSDSSI